MLVTYQGQERRAVKVKGNKKEGFMVAILESSQVLAQGTQRSKNAWLYEGTFSHLPIYAGALLFMPRALADTVIENFGEPNPGGKGPAHLVALPFMQLQCNGQNRRPACKPIDWFAKDCRIKGPTSGPGCRLRRACEDALHPDVITAARSHVKDGGEVLVRPNLLRRELDLFHEPFLRMRRLACGLPKDYVAISTATIRKADGSIDIDLTSSGQRAKADTSALDTVLRVLATQAKIMLPEAIYSEQAQKGIRTRMGLSKIAVKNATRKQFTGGSGTVETRIIIVPRDAVAVAGEMTEGGTTMTGTIIEPAQ